MVSFRVINIIDGDTFDVPGWEWNGQSGTRVRPTGYNAPEINEYSGQTAKQKLEKLALGKTVEISRAYKVDRGRLVSDVYVNGKYLAEYFPEYQV